MAKYAIRFTFGGYLDQITAWLDSNVSRDAWEMKLEGVFEMKGSVRAMTVLFIFTIKADRDRFRAFIIQSGLTKA